MREEEANRLRDIADVLFDHGYDIYMDHTSEEAKWFRWGAEEIRKVIFNSGFNAFNESMCGTTTTKEDNHSRRPI